jgi:hypothetical protein
MCRRAAFFSFVHRTVSYALPGFTCPRRLPLVERQQCCWPGPARCMRPAAETPVCRRPLHAVHPRLPGSAEPASAVQGVLRCKVAQAGQVCRGRHLHCLERQQRVGAAWLARSRAGALQRLEHELRHLLLPAPARRWSTSAPLQAVAIGTAAGPYQYRCKWSLAVALQVAYSPTAGGSLPAPLLARCLHRPMSGARRASCAACSGPAAAALPRSRAAERPL